MTHDELQTEVEKIRVQANITSDLFKHFQAAAENELASLRKRVKSLEASGEIRPVEIERVR